MTKNILIIGATSAIASAVARIYAKQNTNIYLVARNKDVLNDIKNDLTVFGAKKVFTAVCDLADTAKHKKLITDVKKELKNIDVALIAHGTLPNQSECETDFTKAYEAININGLSAISLMGELANTMENQKSGTIAVISSVAGDRGRMSNYIYGTAKAMVSTYAQGLRNRLQHKGINVLTVKPGFVDTPMTAHLPKNGLYAKPEKVASEIVNAINAKKDILYTPFIWWGIMTIMKNIPERIFKRLKL